MCIRDSKKNGQASFHIKKELHFIRYRKIFYIISVVILALGLVFGVARGLNYGIDFTGGTMIQMDMGKEVKTADVEKAIKDYKLNPEIIYSGDGNKEIVILSLIHIFRESTTITPSGSAIRGFRRSCRTGGSGRSASIRSRRSRSTSLTGKNTWT